MSPHEPTTAAKYIADSEEIEITEEDLDRIRLARLQMKNIRSIIQEDLLGARSVRESMSDLVKTLKR